MFSLEETEKHLAEAVEYYLRTDPLLSAKLATALGALQKQSPPDGYIWTETYIPEKTIFRLTLWQGSFSREIASLGPESHYWVQYCGSGWNLHMNTPVKAGIYLGQMGSFAGACALLRARAKKEWGCPLTMEEEAIAAITPNKPWA